MWDEIIKIIQNAFSSIALTSDDLFNLIFSLTVAIVIGIIISQTYRITHHGVNFESTFMTSLVMLAPIVAIVMFFIQGNLVLSLGLVGSISIIRFRTPIKDTRDMVYLFWAIAIGLGAGTYHWGIVIISSIIVVILVAVLYFIKYGRSQSNDYILVLNGPAVFQQDQISKTIKNHTIDAKMRSQSRNQNGWEVVYELQLSDNKALVDDLMIALNKIESINNISLLAPQLALPA